VLVGGAKQTITVDEAYITESIKKPDPRRSPKFTSGTP
jgi:hypothetical protein